MKNFVKSVAISTAIILLLSPFCFAKRPTPPIEKSGAASRRKHGVELIKKAYENQRLVPHKGVLNTIVFLGENAKPHRSKKSVVEICQKDGKMRMDYKSGDIAKMSIIDDGKKMMHLDYKKRNVAVRPIPFSHGDISLLLSNYEVISKGAETIAERPVQIIQLKARHAGNPAKKIWIDIETFLPLKREHYDSDGAMITRSFYTKIDYDARIKDSDFSLIEGWKIIEAPQNMKKAPKKQLAEIVGFDIVEPKYVPAGYVLDGFYLFSPPMRQEEGVHLRYIDGLNSISVFEVLPDHFRGGIGRMRRRFGRERGMRRGQQERPRRRMLGNRQGKMIRIVKDGLNIIVAGDIAEAELQKIAGSF